MNILDRCGGLSSRLRQCFVLLLCLAVASCGGSGGGSSSPGVSVVPPAIATQPQNASVSDGAAATFCVAAAGSPPFTYQWSRGGAAIAGATGATYTIPNVQLSDNGATFAVAVAQPGRQRAEQRGDADRRAGRAGHREQRRDDGAGRRGIGRDAERHDHRFAAADLPVAPRAGSPSPVRPVQYLHDSRDHAAPTTARPSTSSCRTRPAPSRAPCSRLSVTTAAQAPTGITLPQFFIARLGNIATFTVTPQGSGPFTFQWFRNGQPIAGAQASSYTIGSVQLTDNNAAVLASR